MTSYFPRKWNTWILLPEWWDNANYHFGLKLTPFTVLYGYPPPQLTILVVVGTSNAMVEDYLYQRCKMTLLLKDTPIEAQNRKKEQADKDWRERSFEVGDWVYLKLLPYRQTSIEVKRSLKLSLKFYGPYRVTQKVGNLAYKSDLPSGSKIHSVFHLLQLKKNCNDRSAIPELPLADQHSQMKIEPISILLKRDIKKNNTTITQYLVK